MFKANKLIYIPIFLWLAVAMHIYIPSMGGAGLNLPANALSWFVILLIIAQAFIFPSKMMEVRFTSSSIFFIAGSVILSLPLLYTKDEWFNIAALRVLSLWGGVFFYLTLQQSHLRKLQKPIISLIIFATFVQAVVCVAQYTVSDAANWSIYSPSNSRPAGVFRQINVMASFIATGLILSSLSYIRDSFSYNYYFFKKTSCITIIILLTCALILCQSLTGFVGAFLALVTILIIFYRSKKTWEVLVFTLCGIAIGILIMMITKGSYIDHEQTSQTRLFIIKNTLDLITESPILGIGYGGWEFAFIHYARPEYFIEHPHNELLLWWSEGGVFGLVGIALILMGIVFIIINVIKKQHYSTLIGVVPIAFHTLTEHPFYTSNMHYMLFIMLIALSDVGAKKKLQIGFANACLLCFLGMGIISWLLISMFSTFDTGIELSKLEAAGFSNDRYVELPVSAWMIRDRYNYAVHMQSLLNFNNNGDEKILEEYITWGNLWISEHPDRNVYLNLIEVYKYLGLVDNAERIKNEYDWLFHYG